jgi:hypothetical protein
MNKSLNSPLSIHLQGKMLIYQLIKWLIQTTAGDSPDTVWRILNPIPFFAVPGDKESRRVGGALRRFKSPAVPPCHPLPFSGEIYGLCSGKYIKKGEHQEKIGRFQYGLQDKRFIRCHRLPKLS